MRGLRGLRVRLARARRVVQLLTQLSQPLEEGAARGRVLHAGRVVGDDLRGLVEPPRLLEQARGRHDGAIVLGRQLRDTLPGLGGRAEVLALGLLERRELLLELDLRFDVARDRGLLLVEVGQLVPALRLLEQPGQGLPCALVGPVDGQKLPPRVDRPLDVPQVALAESRDLAQALAPGLHRVAARQRAGAGEQHVPQLRVVALGAQVVLDPRERLRVRRVDLEHLLVLGEGVGLLVLAREHLRRVEQALDAIGRHRPGAPAPGLGGTRRGAAHHRPRPRRGQGVSRHALGLIVVLVRPSPGGRRIVARPTQDVERVLVLACGLVARRQDLASLVGHGPARVGIHVRKVPARDVLLARQRSRVVRIQLQPPVVARVGVERATRVREPVLAVVRLGERDEQARGEPPLGLRHRLALGQPVEDRGRELLLHGRIAVVDLLRHRERLRGPGQVPGRPPRRRLVAQEREPPLGIGLDRELHLVHGERVLPLRQRLVDLAHAVDGERAVRIELDRAAVVLDGLLRLGERRVAPQLAELLVETSHLAAQLRLRAEQGAHRPRAVREQGDERPDVALVPVELGQAVGRDLLRRILVDRHLQQVGGVVGIPQRRRPHVGRLAQPVARVGRVARLVADLLEQVGVRLRVRRPGLVSVRERLFVVGVGDESLDERVDFTGIHGARRVSSFVRSIERFGSDPAALPYSR